nr:MAG TPA_asm: hypothetical protein [Caudoviricetes sp.]
MRKRADAEPAIIRERICSGALSVADGSRSVQVPVNKNVAPGGDATFFYCCLLIPVFRGGLCRFGQLFT